MVVVASAGVGVLGFWAELIHHHAPVVHPEDQIDLLSL